MTSEDIKNLAQEAAEAYRDVHPEIADGAADVAYEFIRTMRYEEETDVAMIELEPHELSEFRLWFYVYAHASD